MSRLRDGVIKRGTSWSYVIRVPDPATGVSKPRWVGGFETEADAKAARDDARVRARRTTWLSGSTRTLPLSNPRRSQDIAMTSSTTSFLV
jgi:integrase